MTMTLSEALILAATAHGDQADMAGEPYLLHLLRVGLGVFNETHSVDACIVGILHDVVEDTDVTLDELARRGLTGDQLRAVDGMTKREGECYEDRITRGLATGGPFYRPTKTHDLEDNMNIRRLKGRRTGLTARDAERLSDYLQAWTRITAQ